MSRHNRSYWYIFLAPLLFALYGIAITDLVSEPLSLILIAAPVAIMLLLPNRVACLFIGHRSEIIRTAIGEIDYCSSCRRGVVLRGDGHD